MCRKLLLLFRRAAFHLNLAQHFVPAGFGAVFDLVEIPSRDFFLQILLRLFHAGERDAVAKFQNFLRGLRRNQQPFPILTVARFHRHGRAELSVNIRLHGARREFAFSAKPLHAGDTIVTSTGKTAFSAVGQQYDRFAGMKGESKVTASLSWGEFSLDQRVVKSRGIIIGRLHFLIICLGTIPSIR